MERMDETRMVVMIKHVCDCDERIERVSPILLFLPIPMLLPVFSH